MAGWYEGFLEGRSEVDRNGNRASARHSAGKRVLRLLCSICPDGEFDPPRTTLFDLEEIYSCPNGHRVVALWVDGGPGKTWIVYQNDDGSR